MSVVKISAVGKNLTEINEVSIPLNRILTQLLTDSDIFRKEMQKSVGSAHWNDPHWSPRLPGSWLKDLMLSEFSRSEKLLNQTKTLKLEKADWIKKQQEDFLSLDERAKKIHLKLTERKLEEASELYISFIRDLEDWYQHMQFGVKDFDRSLQKQFEKSQNQVEELRTGLELILLVVFSLSLLILWLGERALRPLHDLTQLVRQITSRGLKREDKDFLESLPVSKSDEVSQLSVEFHRMATQLLEREKEVENQKARDLKIQLRLRETEHLADIGRMSAQVAHEIRNPLHSMGLETEMATALIQKVKDPAQRSALQSMMVSIGEGIERLESITQNYLKLSKMSVGEFKTVDLREVIVKSLTNDEAHLSKKNVKVNWTLSSFMIKADRSLLEQALGNLIQNSIQACEGKEDRRIEVRMSTLESGRAQLIIEDSGEGIAPELREKLFTPFVTTKTEGTGLGLSFVKKVLEEHGAEIFLTEPKILTGASFCLLFPEEKNFVKKGAFVHESFITR